MRTLVDRSSGLLLRGVARALSEALHPRRCALCARADPGDGAGCSEHRLALGFDGPRCGRCVASLPAVIADGALCAACRIDPPGFRRAACLVDYAASDGVRAWVLALKHGGRRDLARPLGTALGVRLTLEESSRVERVLVPVPLHPLRRLERGYDQARLLAEFASESSGVPHARVLRRTRFTTPQGAPGSVSRAANVRQAFAPSRFRARAARAVRAKEVWLVDDVLTSGATAAECALVLRGLGAARVAVLALARA